MTHYGHSGTFDNFKKDLERRRESAVIISRCRFRHFDDQINQTAIQLELVRPVEYMVFPGVNRFVEFV